MIMDKLLNLQGFKNLEGLFEVKLKILLTRFLLGVTPLNTRH